MLQLKFPKHAAKLRIIPFQGIKALSVIDSLYLSTGLQNERSEVSPCIADRDNAEAQVRFVRPMKMVRKHLPATTLPGAGNPTPPVHVSIWRMRSHTIM